MCSIKDNRVLDFFLAYVLPLLISEACVTEVVFEGGDPVLTVVQPREFRLPEAKAARALKGGP